MNKLGYGKKALEGIFLIVFSLIIMAVPAEASGLRTTDYSQLPEDIALEDKMIERYKEHTYPLAQELTVEQYKNGINEDLIMALNSGFNRLAKDIIENNKDYIDYSYENELGINMLSALAISDRYEGGDIELFLKLIESGVKYSGQDPLKSQELLHATTVADNYKLMVYLLENGGKMFERDHNGKDLLDYINENGAAKSYILFTKIVELHEK